MMTSAQRQSLNEIAIRQATVKDLPVCAAICNEYIDSTLWLPRVVTAAEVEAMFAPTLLETRTVILGELDDEIVGYLSANMPECHVVALYLKTHARGLGIGKQMLDAAKALLPGGFELNVFETNTDAQRFYTREGLIDVPEGRVDVTDEGIPTLRMRWQGARS